MTTSGHAKLAPSSAYRWSVCTASPAFIATNQEAGIIPKDSSSKYADEGTEAHNHAALMLDVPAFSGFMPKLPAEMEGFVINYVHFVRQHVEPGDRVYIERTVSLFYSPEETGTVDVLIVKKSGRVVIIDLKYGQGVSVEAFENPQLGIYAESAIRELEEIETIADDAQIDLFIYQPRDRANPDPIRLWKLTRASLALFCAALDAAAQGILSGQPTQFVANPDEQCRFCPAAGICKAYAEIGLVAVGADFDNLDKKVVELAAPDSITREQRQTILAAKKTLIAWLEAVEDQEMNELLGGAKPMGFKLVEGKSNRQWTDEDAIEKLLRNHLAADQVRPPGKVVSPAQAEKLLKGLELSTKFQNKFDALITKPQGNPTLVVESDPRPALTQAIEFPDLSESECV